MSRHGDTKYKLTSLIRRAIDRFALNRLQTSLPGEIVSYDSSTKLASVRPLIGNGAVLEDVPVLFPGNGNGIFEFDLSAGDAVWIIWSKFDLIPWRTYGYGKLETPSQLLAYTGAVCFPWGRSNTNLMDRLLPEGGSEGMVLKKGMGEFDYEWGTDETS